MALPLSVLEVAPAGLERLATTTDKAIGATALHLIHMFPVFLEGSVTQEVNMGYMPADGTEYQLWTVDTRYSAPNAPQVTLPGLPDQDITAVITRHQELRSQGPKPEDPLFLRSTEVGNVTIALSHGPDLHDIESRLGIKVTGGVLIPQRGGYNHQKADMLAIKARPDGDTIRQRFINAYRGALVVADIVAAAGEAYGITDVPRDNLVELFGIWSAQPFSLSDENVSTKPAEARVIAWSRERLPELGY